MHHSSETDGDGRGDRSDGIVGRATRVSLCAAGVVASYREGAIRLSPRGYTTIDEMARVATILDEALTTSATRR